MEHFFYGDFAPKDFWLNALWALFGVAFMLNRSANFRDQLSARTPYKFSFRFLLWDNRKRIVTALVCMYLALRFSEQFLGMPHGHFTSLFIGLSADRIGHLLGNGLQKFKGDKDVEKDGDAADDK